MRTERMKRKGRCLRWLPAIAWFCVMMLLSRQTGSETARVSGFLARMLIDLLARFGIAVEPESFHHGLRTAAHFIAYFIWAPLLFGALNGGKNARHWRAALLTILICCAVAAMDELQKSVIPGRHCSWGEAGLDCVGALCGTALRWGSQWGWQRFRARRSGA